ncbi:hypothetical protein FSZ17_21540 [Cytobacillus dafuensis]|uniref:ATLF-like domain-containing protein n=2 Tax=Cytobacillus dafuensis TaxID=1742359 RepID=A0A5B8Z946_CYTDA|nr:hypothetical protein FSZ17_21540 [Cytobacillus dafuensis]
MNMRKCLLMIAALFLLILINPEKPQAATVYWDGVELKKGQIGRVTIVKPLNLWKRTENGLQFERQLQKGEKYRVYRMDDQYGGQFGVGGDLYITNIEGHVIYETPSISKRKLLDCDQECLVETVVISPENNRDSAAVKQIKERLKPLPESILVQLITQNIHVHLVNGPITDMKEFSHLKGVVPRGWEGTNKTWDDVPGIGGSNTVAVRIGYSDKGNGHSSVNLELHELAHSIDSILKNNLSSTSAFHTVWNSEKKKLFPVEPYFNMYPEEYFSEAFAMYYRDKDSRKKLQKLAPKTYQVIENIK